MQAIQTLKFAQWTQPVETTNDLAEHIEQGQVLFLPQLGFDLSEAERRFLSPDWLDGGSKSIYLRGDNVALKGTWAVASERDEIAEMIARYRRSASGLVKSLFPAYADQLIVGPTSYRPCEAAGRTQSWRHDDTRMHTDAFPSQPLQGKRILRVFANVNPEGKPRMWRVGEPFADMARRFIPKAKRSLPGLHWLMHAFRVTKSRRTEYDHLMLQLHDLQKADLEYQEKSPQLWVPFPPGTTWICYSDQVLHAVMSGQFLFEQTIQIPHAALIRPQCAPLTVLEEMTGRRLAA